MGVWIETGETAGRKGLAPSHPSWVCGLKQLAVTKADGAADVTPFVGVWIETRSSYTTYSEEGSHPSWVCGLKLAKGGVTAYQSSSHPSWVCGLKLLVRWYPYVALSHTLRGCVD